MLNILKRELHLRCLLNDDTDSNPLICVFCCHLSFKPGNTSTKSLGLSPRTISRRIVDTDNPKPTIPAVGNSETILRLPRFAVTSFQYVALVWCFRNDNVSRLGDKSAWPCVAIHHLSKSMVFSGHDVW